MKRHALQLVLMFTLMLCSAATMLADSVVFPVDVMHEVTATYWLGSWNGRLDYDYAVTDGWGSVVNTWPCAHCRIPGGEYFETDLIGQEAATQMEIWWDFNGTPWLMTQLAIQLYGPDGIVDLFYEIHRDYWKESDPLSLTFEYPIRVITFQGQHPNVVPEPRMWLLLAVGLAFLTLWKVKKSQRNI